MSKIYTMQVTCQLCEKPFTYERKEMRGAIRKKCDACVISQLRAVKPKKANKRKGYILSHIVSIREEG